MLGHLRMISLLFPLLTIIPGLGRSEVVTIYPDLWARNRQVGPGAISLDGS